jgi:hypothetical protein
MMEEISKSKAGGRPVKIDKLSKRVRVRMSEKDMIQCRKKAQQANLSLPEYIRVIVVKGKVSNIFSDEEQQHKIQLIGMANNLNQLTKEAHTYGLVSVEHDLKESLRDVREILDRYKL